MASLGRAVDDGDVGDTRQGGFDADGSGGAAGSEEDEGLAGWVGDFGQRLQEAFAVGVFADEFAVAEDGAVDGSDDGGGFAEAVKVFDDGDFVGQRAVEADPTHGAGPANGVGQLVGADFTVDVAPVEVVMLIGGFKHRDSRIFGAWLRKTASQCGEKVHCVGYRESVRPIC